MEIESLKCFLSLSEKKKFTEAAFACNMSQSTFSKRIKKLENEIGVQLFKRSMQETVLTQEGELFYGYARQIVQTYERALIQLRPNSIRLGCMSVLSPYHMPKILNNFTLKNHTLDLYIKESSAKYIMDHMDDFDFVLIREDLLEKKEEYKIHSLIDDELCIVVSKKNALSNKESVDLKEIKDEPLIFPEKGSGGYEIFYKACQNAGFEPKIQYEMPHTSTMFSFVEEDAGIALSFKRVYKEFEGTKIKMIPLKNHPHYPIALVYKKNKALHPIQKDFIEYCKEYLK